MTQASAISDAEMQQRIQAAVEKAVDIKTTDLMKEVRVLRVRMSLAAEQMEQDEKRRQALIAANYGPPKRYLNPEDKQ